MKVSSKILFIFISLTFSSCLKDKISEAENYATDPCDECIPIPPIEGYSLGYYYEYAPTYNRFVSFNPNNDNEILFVEKNLSSPANIVKYNLITNTREIIYTGIHISKPDWGKLDWIIFGRLDDKQIVKMKSNGDSLQNVTSNGEWFHPEWNFAGDMFMAFRGNVDVNDYYNGVIWGANGVVIDTFDWSPISGDWSSGTGLYAGIKGNSLTIINPYLDIKLSSYSNGIANLPISSFNWLSENEGLLTNRNGIYHINVWTNEVVLLKCTCSSMQYAGGAVNSDASKIIYEKTSYMPFGNGGLKVKKELVIMNVDGSDEIILDIQ